MEEHRYVCPTHVREFTRYRGHFNPSQDAAPTLPGAPDDDAEPEPAPSAEHARGAAGSDPMAAR